MPKSNTAVVTIGIDPGKNTLHLIGLDARGGIVLREKVARAKIVSRLANVPPCLIGRADRRMRLNARGYP
jgi:transposase